MRLPTLNSIRKNLFALVFVAALPALAIIIYSGIEQRRHAIEAARHQVLLLTGTMAEAQKDVTQSTETLLSTLALLPQIRSLQKPESTRIFRDLLEKNMQIHNIALADPIGRVLASGLPFAETNLSDRQHFQKALREKRFAVGEYIITRVGLPTAGFPFAYPVLSPSGDIQGVLTAVINLSTFARFQDTAILPAESFLAVTDRNGVRLFYHPSKPETNPMGQPISARNWDLVKDAREPGTFVSFSSDAVRRIFAYRPIRLGEDAKPYMIVWAGIPESRALSSANAVFGRNLTLMLLGLGFALLIAWTLGRRAFLSPINNLIDLTRQFGEGNLSARSPLADHSKEFLVLSRAFNDMAERVEESRLSLQQSEEETRLILNSTAEAIFGLDPAGRCTFCNGSCLEMLGYQTERELLGRNLHELIHHKTREGNSIPIGDCRIYETFQQGKKVHVEDEVFWKADGTWIPVEYWSHPVIKDGTVAGAVVTFLDLTEKHQAEEERRRLEEQLHQAQKIESVGRLAGGVAHDYNNMLGVIIGYAELAQMKVNPESPLREDLEQILVAARRSRDITQQLLAFARKQTLVPRVLDLNAAVESLLKMLRQLLGENIELAWHPDQNLWPVRMDPSQLDQVLANLCVNARDAISDIGKMTIETGKVTLDQTYCRDHPGFKPGDFVLLAVSDNGCGMDAADLQSIFEPFFTTKPLGKGTGLGLPMVYGAVKQSGGFINVYSEPGQGSTFKIYLPRYTGKEVVEIAASPGQVHKGRGETILVVEDEAAMLRLAITMLEEMGYQVLAASSPSQALQLAEECKGDIDLLLTDVIMPEMNGRELAARLELQYPQIRTIYMSGYTENAIAHHGVLDKGVRFIHKPFSREELSTRMRETLRHES